MINNKESYLFATHTGRLIDLNNFTDKDICLEDISHHLTQEPRFGGSLDLNIKLSVASHSLNCYQVAKWIFPKWKIFHKICLLHDATEAYLKDIPSGVKSLFPDYKKYENILQKKIYKKFNVYTSPLIEERLHIIDKRMMLTEVYFLNKDKYHLYKIKGFDRFYSIRHIPCDWKILPDKYPYLIKELFLETCRIEGIIDD